MRFLRSKWRKLKRFFTHRQKPQPSVDGLSGGIVPSIEEQSEDEIIRRNTGAHRIYKRVAFVQAHDDSASGCASYPVAVPADFPDEKTGNSLKRREYDISGYVLGKAKRMIDVESFSMAVELFNRTGRGIRGVGRQLEKFKPDLVISGHKNSVGHKSDVEGREILLRKMYKGTFAEKEARRMLRLMEHFIGPSPLRGDKGIRWTDRKKAGDYNLDVYDDSGCKVVMLLEEDFIGKATPTAKQLMEGEGLNNNAKAIAYFCLGYDVIGGELVL